jgi:uncharacterized repeat protein (TIGR03843 family)
VLFRSVTTTAQEIASNSGVKTLALEVDVTSVESVQAAAAEAISAFGHIDALVNNADRKAGHLLTDSAGQTFGIDHGVTFNAEDKLRTVLWGWIGQDLTDEQIGDLKRFETQIAGSELEELLDGSEIQALQERLASLVSEAVMPSPSPHWPAVPWPVF